MSGTPRPTCWSLADGGTFALACHVGRPKTSLTPPPVAPPPGPSFHTTSSLHTIVFVVGSCVASSRVPPQPKTLGLEAGKSTCACPSVTLSLDPSSPEAQHTVTPNVPAVWNA